MRSPEQAPPQQGTRAQIDATKTAFRLMWRSGRLPFVTILIAMLVAAAATAATLVVGRELLEAFTEQDSVTTADLMPLVLGLGGLMLVGAVAQMLISQLGVPLEEALYKETVDEVLTVAAAVDYERFEEPGFHDELGRAFNGTADQTSAIVFGLVTVLSTIAMTAAISVVLLAIVPVLVPIAFVAMIPIAIVTVVNNKATYAMEYSLIANERERGYIEYVLTDRLEAKEVRSYGTAATFRRWHDRLWDTRLGMIKALVRRRLKLATIATVVSTGMIVATLGLTLALAADGTISLGDAAVGVVGLQQLSGRLFTAGASLGAVHEAVTFLGDFERFRANLVVAEATRATTEPPTPPSRVTVDRVAYRYPGAERDAISDISLEVRQGEVLALVGANGSGKSTLAKLLCNVLEPTAGEIAWDGTSLAGCDPDLVRRQIAPVYQDYSQPWVTIGQAVGLGDTERITDAAAIEETLQLAGLGELLAQHEAGSETRLGKEFEGGIDVSIGQWQRLAIARAIYRDAPILVLDEPSASLDPQAEADLFELLRQACADKIVVFISHRFATVRGADRVIVLDQGSLVEEGSHDELMAERGLYAELFEIQAARFGK